MSTPPKNWPFRTWKGQPLPMPATATEPLRLERKPRRAPGANPAPRPDPLADIPPARW